MRPLATAAQLHDVRNVKAKEGIDPMRSSRSGHVISKTKPLRRRQRRKGSTPS
jgi:hypothetical protein